MTHLHVQNKVQRSKESKPSKNIQREKQNKTAKRDGKKKSEKRNNSRIDWGQTGANIFTSVINSLWTTNREMILPIIIPKK